MEIINGAKIFIRLVKHAGKTLIDTTTPVPKTKIHPLMPIHPRTIGEMIRGYPWKYNFKYTEFSFWVFGTLSFFFIWKFFVKQRYKDVILHNNHFLHNDVPIMLFGNARKQKIQDDLYFMKYYPLREEALKAHN